MKYVGKLTAAILLFTFIPFCVQARTPQEPAQPETKTQSTKDIQRAIEDAYRQETLMHDSRVSVHVKSKEIWLRGVVLTHEAELLAVKIAKEHAGGRKVVDHLKVNPNTHPGSGI